MKVLTGAEDEPWTIEGGNSVMQIAIASGKGGTGKTLIATSLATLWANQGRQVSYVDADVEEPNGHLFLQPEIISHLLIPRKAIGLYPNSASPCSASRFLKLWTCPQ